MSSPDHPASSIADSPGRNRILEFNGRRLGYAQFGRPDGAPVLYFHGCPSSRLQALIGDSQARGAGVSLLSIDRPGLGLSTYVPGRKVSDWPPDVIRLADHLGWESFSILAISGGGPYALACARMIPDRLKKVIICSGVPSPDWLNRCASPMKILKHASAVWQRAPWLLAPILALVRWQGSSARPVRVPRQFLNLLPSPDREVAEDRTVLALMRLSFKQSFRQSNRAILTDARCLTADWGFDPDQITRPVVWWHGDLDPICPIDAVREVLSHRCYCRLKVLEGEGHYSIAVRRIDELIAEVNSP